jgi:hypothetical protein
VSESPRSQDAAPEIRDAGTIDGWGGLSKLVSEHYKKGWIFRGVRWSKYGLRPSIGRQGMRKSAADGSDLPYSISEERKALQVFKREAAARYSWPKLSELEWMVLGQHTGLPTRMVDWTENPLVAAYFAVEDPRREAAIYGVVAPPDVTDMALDPFAALPGPVQLVRPSYVSPRIPAQLGVLTVHARPDIDWVAPEIHRWTIPAAATFTLKGILAYCGFHSASMFPDSADQHTQYVSWRHKWNRLP